MSLSSITSAIIFVVLLLLVLTGMFASPGLIALAVGAIAVLVPGLTYAILTDENAPTPMEKRTKYKGYLRH